MKFIRKIYIIYRISYTNLYTYINLVLQIKLFVERFLHTDFFYQEYHI